MTAAEVTVPLREPDIEARCEFSEDEHCGRLRIKQMAYLAIRKHYPNLRNSSYKVEWPETGDTTKVYLMIRFINRPMTFLCVGSLQPPKGPDRTIRIPIYRQH